MHMELLQSFFSSPKYTIKESSDEINILDNRGHTCITFEYISGGIYIHNLNKCLSNSGTANLQLLENYARASKFKKIELLDASHLDICNSVSVSLAFITILTEGQSWYNKLGYKSESFDAEYAHNTAYIQQPFVATLDLLGEPNVPIHNLDMPINNTMTVQEFFTNIKKYLKNNTCDKTQATLIRNLIALFTRQLKYDESLVKYITVHAGKRGSLNKSARKQSSLRRRRRSIAIPRSLRKSSRR